MLNNNKADDPRVVNVLCLDLSVSEMRLFV
jgi:hypothetical protein